MFYDSLPRAQAVTESQLAVAENLMNPEQPIRSVGRRRVRTPEESLRLAEELREFAESRSRFPRPRGFVFKAKTREEYERWRSGQSNPRLW